MGESKRIAIVDCETTGLREHDEAIAIAVVLLDVDAKGNATRISEWLGKQYPKADIHPMAARVHGMTKESLAGSVFDVEGLRASLTQAQCLIAHNAAFDARMIGKVVPQVLDAEWRCTYRQWPWPKLQNRKLDSACGHFSVERPKVHDAMADVDALIAVLSQRSGTTDRSSTYLGKLLARENFAVRAEIENQQSRSSVGPSYEAHIYVHLGTTAQNPAPVSSPVSTKRKGKTMLYFWIGVVVAIVLLVNLGKR